MLVSNYHTTCALTWWRELAGAGKPRAGGPPALAALFLLTEHRVFPWQKQARSANAKHAQPTSCSHVHAQCNEVQYLTDG